MIITHKQIGAIRVLNLTGQFTLGDSLYIFKREMQKGFFEGRYNILLNMEEVNIIDSSGIGCLIENQKIAREKGGDLKILLPSPHVLKALETARLEKLFGMFESEQLALESFATSKTKEVENES